MIFRSSGILKVFVLARESLGTVCWVGGTASLDWAYGDIALLELIAGR
jgi:hypothetical protein